MQRSPATISASLKKVPPFPPVAAKLLDLLADPGVDANEVADLIASDATFTARLLQRANSAEFGFVTDVTSSRRAVALLGLDLTRQITLAHATAAYVGGAPKTEALRRSWQHTIATAVLAEEIAIACQLYTSVAFTAGIMHDIGRLGLLVAYPDEYENVIRGAAERCLDLLDFEEETFGVHHAEAGRMLAQTWGLPAEMAIIAGRHHDACEGAEVDVLRIVHVACRLADALGYDVVKPLVPVGADAVIAELPPRARQRLMQSPEALLKRIEERIREFSGETSEIQPEEALALLATANETHEAKGEVGVNASVSQSPPEAVPSEPVATEYPASYTQPIVIGIIIGIACIAAAAYWLLR